MSNESVRIMWDKLIITALLALMSAALWQIFINTGRITKVEEQIIAIREMQAKQDFAHQREMDRMADDLSQHRSATEKH